MQLKKLFHFTQICSFDLYTVSAAEKCDSGDEQFSLQFDGILLKSSPRSSPRSSPHQGLLRFFSFKLFFCTCNFFCVNACIRSFYYFVVTVLVILNAYTSKSIYAESIINSHVHYDKNTGVQRTIFIV